MMPSTITSAIRGVAACSIFILAVFLPWAGQATPNYPDETLGLQGSAQNVVTPSLPSLKPASPQPSISYLPVVAKNSLNQSAVLLSDKPAFDKCNPPSIEQMQVWWDKSPYWSINIYIGGISLACDPYRLTPTWMHSVAQQGWTFIPTWVGLQAPCSKFKHKMSSDPAVSYLQGRAEAGEAVTAANNLGLTGSQVIYADIESYSGASSDCRAAVASFLQGWVDGLHILKAKAGAYGASCTSYMTEWAALTPPLDYVWIAHWQKDYYDPRVTVWDAPCLSNNLWAGQQRIKQYTGPHVETWGDLSATLDSDAVYGAVNAHANLQDKDPLDPQLRAARLLSSSHGWALVGDSLRRTNNGGISWDDITPLMETSSRILSVHFLDPQHGWLVRLASSHASGDELLMQSTADGGLSWRSFSLQVPVGSSGAPVSGADLEFVDQHTGWLTLRLHSGSSFSLGRLFATLDGGRTWEERSLPLGEPVEFIDEERGWTAGGPTGDRLFYTADGGRTWQPQAPPLPAGAGKGIYYGLPASLPDGQVSLPVTLEQPIPQLAVFYFNARAETWVLESTIVLPDGIAPGSSLPFSVISQGSWWAAPPGSGRLISAQAPVAGNPVQSLAGIDQPLIALDFVDQVTGWAIAQDGTCTGKKLPAGSQAGAAGDFRCASQTRLIRTADGGRTWEDITPLP